MKFNTSPLFPGNFQSEVCIDGLLVFSKQILKTIHESLLLFKITKATFIMKKKTEKKLNLSKIKVASLSKANQQKVKGGMIFITRPTSSGEVTLDYYCTWAP